MKESLPFFQAFLGRFRTAIEAMILAFALCSVCPPAEAENQAATQASGARASERCASGDEACVRQALAIESLHLQLAQEQIFVANERAQLEDRVSKQAHTHTVLRHQLWMSWLILLLVFAIIGTGLRMSYLQMRHWLETRAEGANSFEISKDGVKLNSPVIGLFIFLISTYFFSVCVDKVYAIVRVPAVQSVAVDQPSKPGDSHQASAPN